MLCPISAYSGISGSPFKKYLNVVLNSEQEKEYISLRIGYKNPLRSRFVITRLVLVMPIGDPQDRFFCPTLTLMIGSYNLSHGRSLQNHYMLVYI